MRAVNHDAWMDPCSLKLRFAVTHAVLLVVGSVASPAKHDMGVTITPSLDNRYKAFLIDTEETVRSRDGFECVDSDIKAAIRAIFEPHC